jgi:signal transduction histidine kinase/DNA-binding response OmpR family regulator
MIACSRQALALFLLCALSCFLFFSCSLTLRSPAPLLQRYMRWPLSVVAGLRRWFKLVLAQFGEPETSERDAIFALELYRLLQGFEFEAEDRLLMALDKNGLAGDARFVALFQEALGASGLKPSRFPSDLTVSVSAEGGVVPAAPSLAFLPSFASLCVGKVKRLRGSPPVDEGHHRVQFYEKGSFICERVIEFLCPALLGDEGVIIIAVPEHRAQLEEGFNAHGCSLPRLRSEGRLALLDASSTLAEFMVNGTPDAVKFDAVIKALVSSMSHKFKSVLAYGEMVNLLCSEHNNPAGAIELEKLWNNLLAEYSFTLMCGYNMGSFGSFSDTAAFREICQLHTYARPTEEFNEGANSKAQAGLVLGLQQQARALSTEVELKEALRMQMNIVAQVQKELAEQELLVKLAHQARQNQQEFLATICHDIRNPLHVVYGVVDCLADEGERLKEIAEKAVLDRDGPDRLLEITARIKENVAALEKCADQQLIVLNDALDLAKMENNMLEVTPVDFSLTEAVHSVMQMFEPHLQQKRLKKEVVLPGGAVRLRADVNRLTQVMNNLLANAIKFTPAEGTITVTAKCEAVGTDVQLHVEVADTGIGISPEEAAQIFKRYKQGGPEITLKYGGTGLGLAICKKLVELMGGTITVQSEKGVGSRLCFSILCEVGGEGAGVPAVSSEVRLQEAAATAVRGKNVLIVEDNKILQRFLASYLEPLGCRYQVANDGIEALEWHEADEWHLIFMDFEMPRLKGSEATRVIREREVVSGKRAVVIGVSANAMGFDLVIAQNAGMDAYLTKPFHKEELYEAITKFDFLSRQSLRMTEESEAASKTRSQKLTLFSRKAITPRNAAGDAQTNAPTRTTADMVFEIDTNFTYVFMDAGAEREASEVFGKEVRVGMSVFEATVQRPDQRDQVIAIWKQAMLGETRTIVETFNMPSGPRVYEITFSSKKDAADKTIGARSVSRRLS